MERVRRGVIAALSVGAFVVVSLLSVSSASAELLNGQLFLDPAGTLTAGCTIPCPFANVTIDLQSSSKVVVTYHALTNSAGYTFGLGGVGGGGGPAGNIAGIDVAVLGGTVPTFSVTNITSTYLVGNSADTSGVHYVPASTNVDGVGVYNLILTWGDDSSHGSTDLLSDLSFTVNNLSGTWGCIKQTGTGSCATPFLDNDENVKTSWTNSLTGANNFTSPSWAMAHLSRCDTDSLPSSCGNTGVVTAWAGGAAVENNVPEPGTLALLGSGILLIGTLTRRFRKS